MESKVDPGLREFFLSLPKTRSADEDIISRRKVMAAQYEKQKAVSNSEVQIIERYIPGINEAPDIRVKIYKPVMRNSRSLPGLLWIHGGGFIYGAPEMDDDLCQRFVKDTNCLVVSVDYRLAPEHPYPAALEDCYAALQWLFGHAEDLGVDAARIAIGGASAGGCLATAVSLLNRDDKGYPIKFLMPLYPMLNDQNDTPSSYEITDRRIWNREINQRAWELYLGGLKETEIPQHAAPIRAIDYSGLPPVYTCIGTLDLFRDDVLQFITRLSQAGVPTEFHLYPGCFHAFEAMVPNAEISKRAVAQYTDALNRGF